MIRFVVRIVLVAMVIVLWSGLCERVLAQDFPYSVPQAPEFDNRGTPVQPSNGGTSVPRHQWTRDSSPQAVDVPSEREHRVDYRSVRPYVPRTGPRSAAAAPASRQAEFSAPPQAPSTAYASTKPEPRRSARYQTARQAPQQAPEQPQGGPPGQLDCSRFPQVIAQAPNEAEMQLAAREYLTCLLRTGWNVEMARKHVINTIQTTFKLPQ